MTPGQETAETTEKAPRYDGLADWYDEQTSRAAEANREALAELLGAGSGRCLNLGCGTGLNFPALRASGRTVVGLDYSSDQLRLARGRALPGEGLLRGDATALPFADAVFDAVTTLWLSTDIDGFPAVIHEAARVLRPGGVLLYYGAHPCFNGPHTEPRKDGGRIVHRTYRMAGLHPAAPWRHEDEINQRLGIRHLPLADLLNAFATAGLRITRAEEPRADLVPWILALRAEKPQHP